MRFQSMHMQITCIFPLLQTGHERRQFCFFNGSKPTVRYWKHPSQFFSWRLVCDCACCCRMTPAHCWIHTHFVHRRQPTGKHAPAWLPQLAASSLLRRRTTTRRSAVWCTTTHLVTWYGASTISTRRELICYSVDFATSTHSTTRIT